MTNIIDDLRNVLEHGQGLNQPAKAEWVKEYANSVAASLTRQFIKPAPSIPADKQVLRVSSLGKPAVLQAINLPCVREQLQAAGQWFDGEPDMKLRDIFHRGDQYEALVTFHLRRAGYTIISTQRGIKYLGVPGHTDMIVEKDGVQILLEVKTMSDQYFRKFVKEPDDERGYLTQMAVYKHCVGLPAAWVCLNKGDHDVAIIAPKEDVLSDALLRVDRIVPKFAEIKCFADVITVFRAPPLVGEVYRGSQTGRYLLPASMKYSPFRHLFYHIFEEKNGYNKSTEYAADYVQVSDLDNLLKKADTTDFATF